MIGWAKKENFIETFEGSSDEDSDGIPDVAYGDAPDVPWENEPPDVSHPEHFDYGWDGAGRGQAGYDAGFPSHPAYSSGRAYAARAGTGFTDPQRGGSPAYENGPA